MSAGLYILSIDLGTSGPKVALVGPDGSTAASAARSVPIHRIPPDGAEQDPEEIWSAIRDATRAVVRAGGLSTEQIVGVSIASQFSSVVAVDREGRPLMNLILWMDGRGAPYARALHERRPEAGARWLDLHGVPPLPSGNDSLSHMLWVQHERPDVYERTHKFLEPMDFVAARLTGNPTANACTVFMMLLTDNRRLDSVQYADELVELSGVDREKVPDLVPVSSCVGTIRPDVARDLGLSSRARVFSGINDTQAVAVGTGAFQEGQGGINIGTTSQVLAHVPFKATDIEQAPPGSGGLLFLPWLAGSQAPSSNPRMRGGFLNLSLDTTRARMVRAILEGVAFNLRWLVPAVERFARHGFDHFRFAGGAARSDEWSQIVADVTNRPVLQLEDASHTINRATAFLAFERMGVVGLADLRELLRVRRSYEPRPETREVYDRLFEQFVAAFNQNRPLFEALTGAAVTGGASN
jgi:xylulokinase